MGVAPGLLARAVAAVRLRLQTPSLSFPRPTASVRSNAATFRCTDDGSLRHACVGSRGTFVGLDVSAL